MKKVIFILSIILVVFCSYFYIVENKQILAKQEKSTEPNVVFHFTWEKLNVGFNLAKVKAYDQIEYVIEYSRENDTDAVVEGSIDNLEGKNAIKRDHIILGSCSEGGTCVYDNITSPITLTIDFINNSEGSDPIYTITKTLNISR